MERYIQDFYHFYDYFLVKVREKLKEFQIVLSGFWNNTMIDEI